ncbi:2-isopropylmalate synthase [Penicillium verhagenii]|uniref:2-isopropylmalate synthase n=1 Tax=Penicillium verhagenii TaxID=1562060 RepID=UPI002544F3DB|nr:2-isopropylmalate synthase [Penicillium verhagenii]KAJ5948140.1 2-isopropylmalate synthase [Penicillium verhagenii]
MLPSDMLQQNTQRVIQQTLGLSPPWGLLYEFTDKLYSSCHDAERLICPKTVTDRFLEIYIGPTESKRNFGSKTSAASTPKERKLSLSDYEITDHENPSPTDGREIITALIGHIEVNGQSFWTQGIGNGAIGCLNESLLHSIGLVVEILEIETTYIEHDSAINLKLVEDGLVSGKAIISYVRCSDVTSCTAWGIGIDENGVRASMKALLQVATTVSSFQG